MRGGGPPQGWDQASGPGIHLRQGPPAPVASWGLGWCPWAPGLLELWRESQGGEGRFLGVPEPGEKRAGPGGGVGEGWRGCLGRREEERRWAAGEISVEGWGGEKAFMSPEPGRK